MPWYAWALVIDIVFSALWQVARVGKPRDRVEPVEAMIGVVVAALAVWAIVALALN